MAASGIVNSVTFTPDGVGDLVVTCTFSAQRTVGSDWGAGAYFKIFMTQSSTTTYGDQLPLSTTRLAYTARYLFENVPAGASVECGLFGGVSGASSCSFWDIQVTAEHIKF